MKRRDWKDPFSWFNWYKWLNPEWLYSYRQGVDPREQGGTFSRADASTCATYIDGAGVVQTVAANVPRYLHFDPSNPSLGHLLLLEGSRKNVVLDSQNLGSANWTLTGTTTRTGSQASPDAGTNGYLIACTGLNDAIWTPVTFTGDGTKAVSVFMKAGTSSTSRFAVYDVTASTFRHDVLVTWTAGVPALSTSSGGGTLFTVQPVYGGFYRLMASANSIVAANTHRIYLYPAGNNASGNTTVFGTQGEDASFCGSYVPTAGAAVTRAADSLSFPFLAPPQGMTALLDFVELGALSISPYVMTIADAAVSNPTFYFDASGGKFQVTQHNGSAAVTKTAVAAPSFGQRTELRGVLYGDGSVQLGQSIAGAAEVTTTQSAANTLASAWSTPTVLKVAPSGFLALRSLKVGRGTRELSWMRNRPT